MFDYVDDVEYMVKFLTIPELVKSINSSKNYVGWDDFIKDCGLAIDILKSYEPLKIKSNDGRQVFESIESIKARYDIVDYIGQYVVLKKSGNKFVGVCPFHSEKRGSFFVYPKNQTWHCFGACNIGGDIITFIQKYDHLEIKDVLKRLSNEWHI
jgi:hypothetical protein